MTNKAKIEIGQMLRIKDPEAFYDPNNLNHFGTPTHCRLDDLKTFDICMTVSSPYTNHFGTEFILVLLRGKILETWTSNLCTVSDEYLKFAAGE